MILRLTTCLKYNKRKRKQKWDHTFTTAVLLLYCCCAVTLYCYCAIVLLLYCYCTATVLLLYCYGLSDIYNGEDESDLQETFPWILIVFRIYKHKTGCWYSHNTECDEFCQMCFFLSAVVYTTGDKKKHILQNSIGRWWWKISFPELWKDFSDRFFRGESYEYDYHDIGKFRLFSAHFGFFLLFKQKDRFSMLWFQKIPIRISEKQKIT